MQKYKRIDRISEEIRDTIDRIIRESLKDPRISGTFSVMRCDVSRDLRSAKIYISNYNDEKRVPMIEALNSASGFIKKELGHRARLRSIPTLIFLDDSNIKYGIHMTEFINETISKDTGNL